MMKHFQLILGGVALGLLLASTGCNKKPDAPIVVEPPSKPAPDQVKPTPLKEDETGTVKVEFDIAVDPRTLLTISGSEYSAKDLEQPLKLKTGKHTIAVKQAGVGVAPREITIDKDQRRIVRVF